MTVRTGPTSQPAASECDVEGTPKDVLSRLLAFREAGAGEFIVRDDARVAPGRHWRRSTSSPQPCCLDSAENSVHGRARANGSGIG